MPLRRGSASPDIKALYRQHQDADQQVRRLGRASEVARESDDPDAIEIGRAFLAAIRHRDALGDKLRRAMQP